MNEPLVDLKLVSSGNSTHTGLMSDLVVQEQILDKLGVAWTTAKIQTGTGLALLTSLSVIKDPVDRFLVDGLGRRLGHSAVTGPLAEIPGSQWFGGLDGFGFIDGPVAEPLHLELTGLDQKYYVMVSVDRFVIPYGGVISSGFLTQGQQISEPVDLLFSSFLPLVNR